jgi:methionyl-tRNA formyltransferase
MTTTSASVPCPAVVCTCGGSEVVTVKLGADRRTGRETLTYSPCAALVAQGWSGNVASVAWL